MRRKSFKEKEKEFEIERKEKHREWVLFKYFRAIFLILILFLNLVIVI